MTRQKMISFHYGPLLLTAIAVAGCNNAAPPASPSTAQAPAADVHDHPTEGPHHGDLVELGNEEYHAEVVHGSGGEVSIYILDSHATNAVPIAATEVTINLSHDGQAEQFKLPAVPDAGDPEGKSSRFTLKDEELAADLDAEGTNAKLVIVIDGKSYSGKVTHSHDHAGEHGHAHGPDDALVWGKEESADGITIKLGHHAKTLKAGGDIEPAVSLVANDQPVADAEVFNTLLAADGQTILANEKPTVYEPESKEEPAHYAQGDLSVPAGTTAGILRFRIVLADGAEHTFDLPVEFK